MVKIDKKNNNGKEVLITYGDNVDEVILDDSVEILQYPKGEYEIMIISDESFPEFILVDLTGSVEYDLDIGYRLSLLNEEFEHLGQWDSDTNNNNFILNEGVLSSQSDDFYTSNLNASLKSLIDLSALDNFEENLVMQLRIIKEIEWDNDKLIVGLESNDSQTFNIIKEISGHDYNWRDLLIPFTANYENQFLKLIFSTDNTVNYRGFSIDNLDILVILISLSTTFPWL